MDSDAKRAEENMGQRTDTLLIASINPEKKKTKLISIPRDMNSNIPDVAGNQKIAHVMHTVVQRQQWTHLDKIRCTGRCLCYFRHGWFQDD